MKELAVKIILIASVLVGITMLIMIYACVMGHPPVEDQIDEENPPSSDQCRRITESQRRDSEVTNFLLLAGLLAVYSGRSGR